MRDIADGLGEGAYLAYHKDTIKAYFCYCRALLQTTTLSRLFYV